MKAHPVNATWEDVIGSRAGASTKTGCRLWQASRTFKMRGYGGYGLVYYQGKLWFAHRLSYFLFNNLPPVYNRGRGARGEVISHECNNPACVEPSHLRPQSQAANMRACVDQGRTAKTRNPLFRHNPERVKEVRARLSNGETGVSLAREFNVSPATISEIKTGRHYQRVA